MKAKAGQRIGSYKNNTSPSGRRVLRSGGPNHSKSCVLVSFLPKLDQPNSQSASQSPPSLGIGGCAPPPGCGYPENPPTGSMEEEAVPEDVDMGAGSAAVKRSITESREKIDK